MNNEIATSAVPFIERKVFRNIYSVIIALVPVIMIFNVPIVNLGVSTVLLGLTIPYAVLYRFLSKKLVSLLPVIAAFGYFALRSHNNSGNLFLLLVVFIHLCGAAKGAIDIDVARKTIETVAIIGTFCILLQTASHYFVGYNIRFLYPWMILKENHDIFEYVSVMYRPSAFFLEPSHYAQYVSIALISSLFPPKDKKVNMLKALWITGGCILTTSGIGIVLCLGIFAWYAVYTQRQKKTKWFYLFFWAVGGIAVFNVMMQFSFFSMAIQRIVGEVNGYNAIWGRTGNWDAFIGPMRGWSLVFGNGTLDLPDGYMTGLMEVVYSYGWLGIALMLILIGYLAVTSRSNIVFCIGIVYCGLMCVANLLGFLSLTFWFGIIIAQTIRARNRDVVKGQLLTG